MAVSEGDGQEPGHQSKDHCLGGRGNLTLYGPISGEMGDVAVERIDYGASTGAPARGTCELLLTSDGKGIEQLACDTLSAYGQMRVNYIKAP